MEQWLNVMKLSDSKSMKTIYLAGGCFWGTEHYISQFEGVVETTVGYANGSVEDPAYEQVYTDQTGHVECVKVVYDDEVISLSTLCRLYFRSIDPLLLNRQGEDIGTRYRTGIYWTDPEDKTVVEEIFVEVQQKYNEPMVVEKGPLCCFYPGEEYHQKYLVKNPQGYCHLSPSLLKSAMRYSLMIKELRSYSDEEKKIVLPRFFKTGKGEYGEGDKFLGIIVPNTRKVAKRHKDVPDNVMEMLLESEWHECRLCALLILREKYKSSPDDAVKFYMAHTKGINNWDLVDLSAPYILGDYLTDKTDRNILYDLADSPVMWEQRIAVVSTLMLIRNGQFDDTLKLAELLMGSRHDLMHKSIGWMLREVGKRDEELLVRFIDKHRNQMPRTMLRYAIEKFPETKRKEYIKPSRP